MALTSLTKDFITRSGLAVEGLGIATTSTYTNGLNTGTLQVAGGASISKNLIVGNTATFYGITYHNNQLVVNSSATIATTLAVSGISTLAGVVVPAGSTLVASGGQTATGASNASGALQVTGGAGISGNLYIGGTAYLQGDLYVDGTQFVVNSDSLNLGDKTIVLSTGSTSAVLATSAGLYVGASSSTAYISLQYDGVNSWVIPNGAAGGGLKVRGVVGTISTNTGALQVVGGVGVAGGVYVGGVVTATNVDAILGTAASAGKIYGGSANSIVYQSGVSTTAFLAAGTAGYILTTNGAGSAPTWSNPTAIAATSATNLVSTVGQTFNIPYQAGVNQTQYSSSLIFNPVGYNGATGLFTTTNVSITGGNNATAATGNSGSLMVQGGVGITQDLWVGGNLNVGGNITLDGVGLDTVQGNTGTFVNVNTTGTGIAIRVPNGSVTIGANLTASNIVITGTNASTVTNSLNALYVVGGVGIDKTLNVSGSTVLQNLTVNGYITGTNLTIGSVTGTNAYFVGDATGNGALYAGVLGGTIFAQTMAQFTGNLNDYMEINVQNKNAGAKASSDIVASADNVGINNGFINMGIASSTWDGSQPNSLGTTLQPNDGYLLVGPNANAGVGDLIVATMTTGTQIRFVVAGNNVAAGTVTSSSIAMVVNQVQTPTNSTASGTLVVGGGVGIAGGLFVGATVTATNLVLTGNETVAGQVNINSVLGTIGTNTGALQVVGGVGIGGGVYVGGTITATNVTVSGTLATNNVNITGGIQTTTLTANTATINGSVVVTGNLTATIITATSVTVSGNETVGGSLVVTNNIQGAIVTATNSVIITGTAAAGTGTAAAGALQVSGGVGVAGGLYVGGTITATNAIIQSATIQNLTLGAPLSFSNITTTNIVVQGQATFLNVNITGTNVVSGVSTFSNTVNVTDPTNTTNTTTGALRVVGGVGIGRDLQVGGTVFAGVNTSGTTATTVVALQSNAFQESSYISQVLGSGQNGIEQYLDTMSTSTYRSAEYTVQITDFPKIHIGKLLLMHDGTNNIYLTEFGVVTNSGTLGTFDAAFTGTNVVLKFTPTSAPTAMTIKVRRTAITI